MEYIRDDIYFCEGCGQFFDIETDKLVEVPYWEMPAQWALTVMEIRKRKIKPCHVAKRSKAVKVKGKGFDK